MAKHLTPISSSALINRLTFSGLYCVKSEPKDGNCRKQKNLKCVKNIRILMNVCLILDEEKRLKWL